MKKTIYPKNYIRSSVWRDETWTGGEHYQIKPYKNGNYIVQVEKYPDEWEIDFTGTYKQCKKYLEDLKVRNADYDLGI